MTGRESAKPNITLQDKDKGSPTTLQQGGDRHLPQGAGPVDKVVTDGVRRDITGPHAPRPEADPAPTENARNNPEVIVASADEEDARSTGRTAAETSCPAKISAPEVPGPKDRPNEGSSNLKVLEQPREGQVISNLYSQNYSSFPSDSEDSKRSISNDEGRQTLLHEQILSNSRLGGSTDSNLSDSDTVEMMAEKNVRLKLRLQSMIAKADDHIGQLHSGIPMEIRLSRKQLARQVRRAKRQLEREAQERDVIRMENELLEQKKKLQQLAD